MEVGLTVMPIVWCDGWFDDLKITVISFIWVEVQLKSNAGYLFRFFEVIFI
jgi:hypothetical protein